MFIKWQGFGETNGKIKEEINNEDNIRLSKTEEESLSKGLLELKTEFSDSDVLDVSSLSESFPWLTDKEGNNIEFTTDIDLFNGVKLVSQYLEKRYNEKSITDVKLTEILKPLFDKKEGEDITVLDLYNHVSTLFNKGEFKETILQGITNEVNNETISDTMDSSKPLGQFGDISLNEVVIQIKDLKWNSLLDSAKITIHATPLAINVLGYGLIMRSYMKFVYNRDLPVNISNTQQKLQHKIRNRNLAIFSFLGAPLILICLRKTALGLKDMSSIEILPNNSNNDLSTNNLNKSGIFLMLSTLNNKIPSWVKLIIKFNCNKYNTIKFNRF